MNEDDSEGATTQRLPTLKKSSPSGEDPPAPGGATDAEGPTVRAGRFWSPRRVPATVVSLLCFGGLGLLLYDIASVRAGRSAMPWRRTLADELATRPLDDVWIRTGAAVAAALGLWLIVLALTPGLRGLLPMRRADDLVRAGLDRSAAEFALRDRAMEVSGVRAARVKVTRRTVKARTDAHFRELEEVRSDVDATLSEGIGRLGLARRPRLSVHVRRQPGK